MMEGLSDTARAEMQAALADLSSSGRGELVEVFEALLAGHDMGAALGLPEGTAALLYAQAHARFNGGEVTEALGLFQALTVLAPQGKDHWLGLGICLRLAGSLGGARLAFATAQEIDPECAAVAYHQAELAFAEGRLADARGALARFAALPDSGVKQRLGHEAQKLVAVLAARSGG